jgi:hypothetical protein
VVVSEDAFVAFGPGCSPASASAVRLARLEGGDVLGELVDRLVDRDGAGLAQLLVL